MFSSFALKRSSRRSNTREIRIGRSVETPGEISRDSDAIGSRRIKECCDAPFVSMLSITPTYRDDRRRHHRRLSFSSEVSVHSVFSLFSFLSFLLFFFPFPAARMTSEPVRLYSATFSAPRRDSVFPALCGNHAPVQVSLRSRADNHVTITRTAAIIAFTKSEKG